MYLRQYFQEYPLRRLCKRKYLSIQNGNPHAIHPIQFLKIEIDICMKIFLKYQGEKEKVHETYLPQKYEVIFIPFLETVRFYLFTFE